MYLLVNLSKNVSLAQSYKKNIIGYVVANDILLRYLFRLLPVAHCWLSLRTLSDASLHSPPPKGGHYWLASISRRCCLLSRAS